MRCISSMTTYVPYGYLVEWCAMSRNVPGLINSQRSGHSFDIGNSFMSEQSHYTCVAILIALKFQSSKPKMNFTGTYNTNINCRLRKLGHWQQHIQRGRKSTLDSLTPGKIYPLDVCLQHQKWLDRLTVNVATNKLVLFPSRGKGHWTSQRCLQRRVCDIRHWW